MTKNILYLIFFGTTVFCTCTEIPRENILSKSDYSYTLCKLAHNMIKSFVFPNYDRDYAFFMHILRFCRYIKKFCDQSAACDK